ncbi:SDR family NAD(P)-dependent oxidoreductase [Halogeometricum borinquense]|uniref:SDR family NAD(P)-dependent oxidoreductase n=1 Tax=Halogeometricum borinquense TaxID=60847 RepID=A0A6C0UJU6_9EURY|nr:SDR family NAD(P)-dependent oxidoreductase [Halogeometricum borinquense]QIB73228.1 SDR family NAD(P)-dependent oxidoreductase [Halogeometricum borinquense]QIQ77376.1 SDR family NAD(P)-dependent oxidoreductase [Halogeometricum borinquense]
MTRTAVVVGASSGIGRALASELADAGYEVGLAARRLSKLESVGADLPTKSYVARMDVSDPDEARDRMDRLADAMDGVDLVVLSAGVGHENRELAWEPERDTVDVNARGFAALATWSMEHFESRGGGHLVGISSVAEFFGNPVAPAYNASKAFVSRYLDGLRSRAVTSEADITVTDVIPGFVDTEMAIGETFWMASPEMAAEQIHAAIRAERNRVYVTRRWRLVALLVRLLPEFVTRRAFD